MTTKTITKGEGLSALMNGYWAAREKLGPMPLWRHKSSCGGEVVRPMERKPDSVKAAE